MWNHAFMFSVTLYHPVRPYKHNFSLALYQQCAYAQAPIVLLISKLQTFKKSKSLEERLDQKSTSRLVILKKFIYSEKAKKFCVISTLLLTDTI